MNSKFLYLIIALIVATNMTYTYGQGGNALIMDLGVRGDFQNDMKKMANIKGTPFLFDNLEKGDLVLSSGKIYNDILFNVNLEKNEIYVKVDEAAGEIILNNKQVSKIIPSNGEISPLELRKFNGKNQIVEVIYEDDDFNLIREHNKNFTKASSSGISTYEAPASNMDQYSYSKKTYMEENGEITEIKSGTNGFKAIGGDNWKKVKKYAISKNLNLSNSQDLRDIVLYAKSL